MENLKSPWGLDVMEAEEKEHTTKIKEINRELNKMYSICFSTPTGKKVLDHLRKCTLDQPTWIPSPNNDGVHNGFVREGQNSIVRNIIDRINSIKNAK